MKEPVGMVLALLFEAPELEEAVADREESRSARSHFANNPSEALSRSLAVIGRELRLERDHDADACIEHAISGDGLLRDYQTYLDRLSTPRDESGPKLLSVAVELLAFNDRIVGEIRRRVVEPLRKTSKRRSRASIRRDFLGYHRTLRDARRRLETAWAEVGSASEHLPEYFAELERASPWRVAVLPVPQELLRQSIESFARELDGAGDRVALCRLSRRIRYAVERLENCRANDEELLGRAARLFERAEELLDESEGSRDVYTANIARRRRVIDQLRSVR